MSPGFVWAHELWSICPPVVLCVLWQVHCPLWDGMHGWLTLTQPICHPHRGGGVCVCVCARVCVRVCVFVLIPTQCGHHTIWVYWSFIWLWREQAWTCVLLCLETQHYCYLSHHWKRLNYWLDQWKLAEYLCRTYPDCFHFTQREI